MNDQSTDFRIFEFIVKTTWIHFEDALRIGKIKLFSGAYRKGQGNANTIAHHYIDVATLRPILLDLQWGKPCDLIDFKGSPAKGDTPCVSRILRVNSDAQGNVWWAVAHGPGTETNTGAIKPAYKKGGHDKLITTKMSQAEARQMACQVLEYLQSYTTAQMLQRLQPVPAPTAVPTPITIEQANEDWFTVPTPRVENNGHVNGKNGATAVADAPPKKMKKIKKVNHAVCFKKKTYGNGEPVHPNHRNMYLAFYQAKRSCVPYDRDRLTGWYYGS